MKKTRFNRNTIKRHSIKGGYRNSIKGKYRKSIKGGYRNSIKGKYRKSIKGGYRNSIKGGSNINSLDPIQEVEKLMLKDNYTYERLRDHEISAMISFVELVYSKEAGQIAQEYIFEKTKYNLEEITISDNTYKKEFVNKVSNSLTKFKDDGNFGYMKIKFKIYPKFKIYNTKQNVIVKHLKVINDTQISNLENEAKIMKYCLGENVGENVAKIYKFIKPLNDPKPENLISNWNSPKNWEIFNGIIMEYCNMGDLLTNLKKPWPKNEIYVKDCAQQICDGMIYLVNKQVVHCDLAARNILVHKKTKNKIIYKITNFGLSFVGKQKRYKTEQLSLSALLWASPEITNSYYNSVQTDKTDKTDNTDNTDKTDYTYTTFSKSTDIWSYGCILMEILRCGLQPWYGIYDTVEEWITYCGEQNYEKNTTFLQLDGILYDTGFFNEPVERFLYILLQECLTLNIERIKIKTFEDIKTEFNVNVNVKDKNICNLAD